MAKNTAALDVQDREDRESIADQQGLSYPKTNGNAAVTRRLRPVVSEPDEPDADRGAPKEVGQEDSPAQSRGLSRRRVLSIVIGIALLAGAVMGVRYWLHARLYEATDDAFIEGHSIQMSPKVSGYAWKLYIDDNQQVKAGDLLVEIDARDYESNLAQARATLSAAIARSKAAQAGLALTRVTTSAGVDQASAGVEAARSGVEQSRAAASAAEGRVNQLAAAVATAQANAEQARAQVTAAQATAVRARADVARYQSLFEKEVVSRQQLDLATEGTATADAQLEAARGRLAAAEAQVGEAQAAHAAAVDQYKQSVSQIAGSQAQAGQAAGKLSEANSAPQQVAVKQSDLETTNAEVAQAQAAVRQAELDLSYTKIYAPEDGRITRKSLEQGTFLQPGQVLFALVPEDLWVVANFKETQLDRMRPGQAVDVRVDAYPDKVFRGHVDSFQAGTGSRFSLLPPENATGNYVKVVQRLPVKIVFDEEADAEHPLAPGMSVEPGVKVR